MSDPFAEPSRRVKGRSPGYPAVNLEIAIERLRTLHEKEREHLTPATSVATLWGYKSLNGPASSTLASLLKFGLVDDEGSGTLRRVRVSKLGVKLLAHPNPEERLAAKREAALRPTIHRELWEEYGENPPSEDTLRWDLTQDRGFTETGAREFIREYMSTVAFAGLAPSDTVTTQMADVGEVEDTGWTAPEDPPRRRSSGTPATVSDHGTTYAVPVAPGSDVVIGGGFPLSEREWAQFIAVLNAMKPALVGDLVPNPNPPERVDDEDL